MRGLEPHLMPLRDIHQEVDGTGKPAVLVP